MLRLRHQGFTLIELLVALTVLSVIALLSWRGVDSMLRLREQTAQHQAATEQLQRALLQWHTDLEAASEAGLLGGLISPVTFDGVRLRVLRKDSFEPAQPLRLVVWQVADTPKVLQNAAFPAPRALLRWQSAPLQTVAQLRTALAAADTLLSSESLSQTVQAVLAVSAWQVDFSRGGAWVNAQSSVGSEEASSSVAALPDAVRLTLTLPSREVTGSSGSTLSGAVMRVWVRPTLSGNKS